MKKQVCLEYKENYQKQSYRNRCCILTGNGVKQLTIPVIHSANKMPITEVRIDYATAWQRNHWRTITSAYGNSPFFLYYQDALQPFFEKKFDLLIDFNSEMLNILLKLLHLHPEIIPTQDYVPAQDQDLRTLIHPKNIDRADYPFRTEHPYSQVFDDKFGFIPNLSVLDLLCNLGNETTTYIQNFCTFANYGTE